MVENKVIDAFHDHLDTCRQCREHPFDLCPTGEPLMRAVTSSSGKVTLSDGRVLVEAGTLRSRSHCARRKENGIMTMTSEYEAAVLEDLRRDIERLERKLREADALSQSYAQQLARAQVARDVTDVLIAGFKQDLATYSGLAARYKPVVEWAARLAGTGLGEAAKKALG